MKQILCRECGSNFEGRLSRTCSVLPRFSSPSGSCPVWRIHYFQIDAGRLTCMMLGRASTACRLTTASCRSLTCLQRRLSLKPTYLEIRLILTFLYWRWIQEYAASGNQKKKRGTPIVEVWNSPAVYFVFEFGPDWDVVYCTTQDEKFLLLCDTAYPLYFSALFNDFLGYLCNTTELK